MVEKDKGDWVVLNICRGVEVQCSSSGTAGRQPDWVLHAGCKTNGGLGSCLGVQSCIDFANDGAEGLSVTLFTSVHNTVTALVGFAVGSAGIGNNVTVFISVVAFLGNFHNTVSANSCGSGITGRECKDSDKGINKGGSSIQTLKRAVVFEDHIGEVSVLEVRKSTDGRIDEPVDILSARRSGLGTDISVGFEGTMGDQSLKIDPS